MSALAAWVRGNLRVYRDNPTTVKDLRSQLRGSKAIWLWTLYLVLLVVISMITYSSVVQRSGSVSTIQLELRGFYTGSMEILAAAICFVTPALTAGSLVTERQRKSLDLLFSAPVSLKGLLVGKVLSAYRYTWMLLVLSIPIASVAVVMGGATWADVLLDYVDLSFCALVLISIGLLISALSESVGAAVIWTYVAVLVYLWVTSMLGAISSVGSMIRPTGSDQEAPFLGSMSPFTLPIRGQTYTNLFGIHMGNWIIAGIVSLLICRLFVLGAAAHLSFYDAKEVKNFRINALLYLFLTIFAISWTTASGVGRTNADAMVAVIIAIACGGMMIFLPHIVCYSRDVGRKYGFDGPSRMRRAFVGARSGSLEYIGFAWILIVAAALSGVLVGINASTLSGAFATGGPFAPTLGDDQTSVAVMGAVYGGVWSFGYFFMMFGLGRGISSRAKSLKNARAGLIGAMIVILGLPIPIISLLTIGAMSENPYNNTLWSLSVFYPFMSHLDTAWVYSAIMFVIGLAGLRLEKDFRSQWEAIRT